MPIRNLIAVTTLPEDKALISRPNQACPTCDPSEPGWVKIEGTGPDGNEGQHWELCDLCGGTGELGVLSPNEVRTRLGALGLEDIAVESIPGHLFFSLEDKVLDHEVRRRCDAQVIDGLQMAQMRDGRVHYSGLPEDLQGCGLGTKLYAAAATETGYILSKVDRSSAIDRIYERLERDFPALVVCANHRGWLAATTRDYWEEYPDAFTGWQEAAFVKPDLHRTVMRFL